jgi:signal transduction histidine kinase
VSSASQTCARTGRASGRSCTSSLRACLLGSVLDRRRSSRRRTNLLSNGIKFTDTSSGKRDILVTINVSRRAPPEDAPCLPPDGPEERLSELPAPVYLYCTVRDSGPGLRPDDLALLFRRFQQGSVSTPYIAARRRAHGKRTRPQNSHNVFGGSGLGLFVSRKLCDLMDGRIDVNSVYGEGAAFRFYIKALAIPGGPISPGSVPSQPASPPSQSGLQ